MSSWANRTVVPMKKKEFTGSSYYEPISNDYADATLQFLYSYVYTQRAAEPFYINDTVNYFQPLLKPSPILHYLKETPSSGSNLATTPDLVASVLKPMSLATLKRTVTSIYQFNGQTEQKLEALLSNYGLLKPVFDVGIVLDVSGCVPQVISRLKSLQSRTGKKSLKVFVMTESMDLLRDFAMTGDKSWSYVSLLRNNAPKTPDERVYKLLAEIRILQGLDYLVVRFSTSLGKLLYLTSSKIQLESQILSVDGSSWKAFE
jgi:hypothetical protein